MIKEAPSLGRMIAMVGFALSCFALLLFLWISFGGSIPLKAKGYRFEVAIPEAATLPVEADVRLAGVSIGRVKAKELDRGAVRTLVEVEVRSDYAPIPRSTRAILRQKTLFGETYLELSPGRRASGDLADGGRLPDGQVKETVELDEVFDVFDPETQDALRRILAELARGVRGKRAEALNDAVGNLAGASGEGARLLSVLDRQRRPLRSVVRNTGTVLAAINDRGGALGGLVENTNEALEATAARDDELAETISILPTSLAETRATLARLERFAGDTRPLIRELRPAAGDLAPTLRDVRRFSPDLEATLRSLDPLIRASRRGVPALGRIARGAGPLVEGLNVFLDELNPVLSLLSFYQARVAGFLSNGGAALNFTSSGERGQGQLGVIDPRSFDRFTERPEFDRGNAYLQPNALNRFIAYGAFESLDCSNAAGALRSPEGDVPQNDAEDVPLPLKVFARRPACLVQPQSLYDNKAVTIPRRGEAPVRRPPERQEGRRDHPASVEDFCREDPRC